MKKIEFGISFGALAPTLSEQITEMDLKFNTDLVAHFEQIKEGLLLARFKDVITESEYDRCLGRLFKKVRSHVLKENNMKLL